MVLICVRFVDVNCMLFFVMLFLRVILSVIMVVGNVFYDRVDC